jgi:SpoVK/Ycf46/Vps4 family AAA+-type ATPase
MALSTKSTLLRYSAHAGNGLSVRKVGTCMELNKSLPPGTFAAPEPRPGDVLDWQCSHFALSLVLKLGAKFNLRRDINDVLNLTARHLVWPEGSITRVQRFLAARCAENENWKHAGELAPQAFLDKHGTWNGTYDDATLFYYLDEYVKTNAKDLLATFQTTVDVLGARLKSHHTLLAQNVDVLARVLSLTEVEKAILLKAALVKYSRDLRPVLVDCKAASATEAFTMLGEVLAIPAAKVAETLRAGSRLEMLGLVDTPIADHNITDLGDLMRVSDRLLPILLAKYSTDADMMAVFTRPAKPTELTLADYPHVESDAKYLIALLKAATSKGERGINVLIYGPPGTGKTEFSKLIAKEAACELYEVDCLDKDGNSLTGKERYRSLQVSQAFLKGRTNTALLFDEVEDVFPAAPAEVLNLLGRDDVRGASVNGKAWVNQTLEQNPIPTIWISNSIDQIDPAYRRRFQFHLQLKTPPANVRETITRKHLSALPVSEEFIGKLAQRKTLTPAQIQSAARFATLTHGHIDGSLEELIERQINYADDALGLKSKEPAARPIVTHYDLSLLNIESRYTVDKMLQALKVHNKGTLCFYGPPGTGKTALAEHIAKHLDKPLMIKRASDLLSKFVGETEQQMAAMFEAAKNEKAVLLLDEADTFLQNRQMAQRSYEVSEVNEMLQGMERFEGVFICTTNLFDRIDEAALRRFTFKIQFKPLTLEQREKMFIAEALDGDKFALTPTMKTRLQKLDMICPGDFATVKRQVVMFDEALPPEDFLTQLETEHKAKPDVKFGRSIGFH